MRGLGMFGLRTFAVGLALALVLCTLSPREAHADSAKEQAKALFLKGRDHFLNERFAEALNAFEQANTLSPHPLMLFNMAKVYERMGDLARSIESYRKYLATNPKNSPEIREKIAEINATLATWPSLNLRSIPGGAVVRVGARNNPPRGRTPITLRLSPERQLLVLEMKGRQSVERWVNLKPGQYKSLSLALPANTPFLSVTTIPPGATVKVDGVVVGQTPVTHGAAAGSHQVSIELAGHVTHTQSVRVEKSHTRSAPLQLALELKKLTDGGFLSLDGVGGQGTVQIDGKPVGVLPLSGRIPLSAGMHKLEIYQGSELVHQEIVRIENSETTLTTVVLGSAGLSNQTIGWIGMGVGGATTLGGLLTGMLAMSADGELQTCRDNQRCARTNQELDLADDVRGKAQMTDVLVGTGLVMAGVGLWFYFMGDDDADSEATANLEPPHHALSHGTNAGVAP